MLASLNTLSTTWLEVVNAARSAVLAQVTSNGVDGDGEVDRPASVFAV
jgi:hypothetical protein